MPRLVLTALLATPALLLATGCDTLHDGNAETDRIAQVVTDAISWPTQTSAVDYARAAAGTSAALDGRLTVVAADELDQQDDADPFARLVYRVHLEGSTGGWVETDPVTACYEVHLGMHGATHDPEPIDCPADAEPVDLPPVPPAAPVAEVAEGSDDVLRQVLRSLGDRLEVVALQQRLEARLPTARDALPPEVLVASDGTTVGVAVRGEGDCLLGLRTRDRVSIWRPADVQLQPGELTCDVQTALARLGMRPPH